MFQNIRNYQLLMKKILFVIESLAAAGAEKSIITFLSVLDKTKFDIDLQLFAYGGEFERFLPKEISLLPPLEYTQFVSKSIVRQLLTFDFPKIISRWKYSFSIRRKGLNHKDRARLFWQYASSCISTSPISYDIAVAYAQNIPTLYVVDKISAHVKFAWINVKYVPEGDNYSFYREYYKQVNHIVMVSDSAYKEFLDVYPDFNDKMTIIKDMLDSSLINKLALEKPEQVFPDDIPCLLTVARLERDQKGYDITLEACRILKERNIRFRWYAIGRGGYRMEMEAYISKYHLENHFVLLGTTPNPYPYIKNCTIYVQTSRYEGFGLSIAEARILNKPVVTTEFDAVWTQMVQGENGLVVPQNPIVVADAIERLINDKQLYDHIVSYQKREKKGNTEEIEKFYQLIDK